VNSGFTGWNRQQRDRGGGVVVGTRRALAASRKRAAAPCHGGYAELLQSCATRPSSDSVMVGQTPDADQMHIVHHGHHTARDRRRPLSWHAAGVATRGLARSASGGMTAVGHRRNQAVRVCVERLWLDRRRYSSLAWVAQRYQRGG